jgi:16S rRNA (uracil1498-N3)-methyltransferase
MIPRLHTEQDLRPGAVIELDAARSHYLRAVLRREAGAELLLFNGRDGEWRAGIERIAKSGARIALARQTRAQQASPDLWLVFAPIKGDRIDNLAEKATELGCSCLWPVFTQHTTVGRVNVERMRANAIEAAEQCERLDVPGIRTPAKLGEILDSWSPARRLIVCAESGHAAPIAEALRAMPVNAPSAVMSGPEGGFARSELDALSKLPFVTAVGLGPRVLRADTAALAALACWQAILGDGRERPPAR